MSGNRSRGSSGPSGSGRRSTSRGGRAASKARAERLVQQGDRTVREVNIGRRLLTVLALFVVAGIGYVGVLVDLQAVRPQKYIEVGENQRSRTVHLPGYRGSIADRDGFVLALSTPGTEVVADPQMIKDPRITASLLAPILDMDQAELEEKLRPSRPGSHYAAVAPAISDEQAAFIAVLREEDENHDAFVGIFVRAQEQRVYPADTLALPVVGRVNPQEIGVSGLEMQLDETMQGTAGSEEIEAGVFGSITGGRYVFDPAVPGNDIVLTLDHRIQYVTEQALIEHCEDTGAKGANAVVSDPRTGEILAMATVVRADGACHVPGTNAPLVETFEPGSVIKMVTVAAAVEDGGYKANTILDVPAELEVGGQTYFNHSPAAPYPIRQVIADSMNTGTIMLAQSVGSETLRSYLSSFGFGRMTGLDFRFESRGRVPEEWFGSDIASIAIGQGISVNTVQLAGAYNAVANGGLYVSPSLVRSVAGPDDVVLPTPAQESHQVISTETAAQVTEMLIDVVASGTGSEAAVAGYQVAGKTGTAWQSYEQSDGSYGYGDAGSRHYVTTFAGFLPAKDPQLSIVVVVNEPGTATSAAKIAAPVFSDIAQYAIRILAIPPDGSSNGLSQPAALLRGTPASASGETPGGINNPDLDDISETDSEVESIAQAVAADDELKAVPR